jgi:dihydroxyacetone kinase-like predicted kinase
MKISIPGMQTLEGLGATDLVAVVTNYRDLLQANRQRINQLNVYPVPDGDTVR